MQRFNLVHDARDSILVLVFLSLDSQPSILNYSRFKKFPFPFHNVYREGTLLIHVPSILGVEESLNNLFRRSDRWCLRFLTSLWWLFNSKSLLLSRSHQLLYFQFQDFWLVWHGKQLDFIWESFWNIPVPNCTQTTTTWQPYWALWI